jgi:transposase
LQGSKGSARLGNWWFGQLRPCTAYKARDGGVLTLFVDPKCTSKGRRERGVIDDKNRAKQATFSYTACDRLGHTDVIAARNIRCRTAAARVTPP